MLSTANMSEAEPMNDQDEPTLVPGDTDAEFELEIEKLNEMRIREAAIRAEHEESQRRRRQHDAQQAALQRRVVEAQAWLKQQPVEMSDDERPPPALDRDVSTVSTVSTASSNSSTPGPDMSLGWVTVVDVTITPHRATSPDMSTSPPPPPSLLSSEPESADDAPLVDVKLHVFQRYVPHLAAAALTIDKVARRHTEYIKQMEDDDGYSSDTSSEGLDDEAEEAAHGSKTLEVTGNREIDAATLRRLIGMTEDDSDDDTDPEKAVDGGALSSTRTSLHDEDEDEEGVASSSPLRTKHELPVAALPPAAPFTVTDGDTLTCCGSMMAVVDDMIVLKCQPGGRALDIGSAICLEDRTPVGRVEEVFGPVAEPFYSVRALPTFDVTKQAPEEGVRLFSVAAHSSYVLADTTPGSDASNPFDEEIEAEAAEFSDDEKEQEAKQSKKRSNKLATSNAEHLTTPQQSANGTMKRPLSPRQRARQQRSLAAAPPSPHVRPGPAVFPSAAVYGPPPPPPPSHHWPQYGAGYGPSHAYPPYSPYAQYPPQRQPYQPMQRPVYPHPPYGAHAPPQAPHYFAPY